MSAVVRWEVPPPHGNSGPRAAAPHWQQIADALRSKPGEWALITEGGPSGTLAGQSTGIRTGERLAAFRPGGSFQARVVKRTDSTSDLYARYVGEVAS